MENDSNKQKKLLQKIKKFCLLNDELMSRVFDENIECTELILRIILDRPDIKVKAVHTQSEIKNLRGRSVRLDIDATSEEDEPIDVEIQREDRGAGVKRARYNSSMIDANTLVKGEDYDKLPESYVIFITENDVMGANLPLYHADRIVAETGKPLGDGTHIIYVNGAYRGDNPIGKLMYDFSCSNPDDMYYSLLAKQVRYYKEDEKGIADMSKGMEDWIDEFIDEEKREMVVKMKKSGKLSNEDIAGFTGFTVEEVEEIDERSLEIY